MQIGATWAGLLCLPSNLLFPRFDLAREGNSFVYIRVRLHGETTVKHSESNFLTAQFLFQRFSGASSLPQSDHITHFSDYPKRIYVCTIQQDSLLQSLCIQETATHTKDVSGIQYGQHIYIADQFSATGIMIRLMASNLFQ